MKNFDPTQIATPVFIILIIIEMIVGRVTAKAHYETKDTAASLAMGLGSIIFGAAFAFLFVDLAIAMAPWRLGIIGWSIPAVFACFVADDFSYYWWHRASHRVRWLWANHVGHHSSQHYNLSTALRQPWTGAFTPGLLFKVPLLLTGFPAPMILLVGGVNLVYQFWIHTEVIGRLPAPLEYIFNTPSHHRVHHATNPQYLDSNYAGVFILWDRWFGSFSAEIETPHYGIVKNLNSFNPLLIAFHEWVAIGTDMLRARRLSDALHYLLAPPGWSPDGASETTEVIRARWRDRRLPDVG